MTKQNTTKKTLGVEQKTLFILSALFVAVVGIAWTYSVHVRNTILATNSATQIDTAVLVEVEKIRNLKDSLFNNSRSYFLLGSGFLFEEQKKEKETFAKALESFDKKYTLPQISELLGNISAVMIQEQEIFDQSIKYRDQKEESKIIGQYYQSKATPLRNTINSTLDKIADIHTAEIAKIRLQAGARAEGAAYIPNTLIPRSMLYFSAALTILFASMMLLVLRLLSLRQVQVNERDRLYLAAQKATQARDEVITAIANDLKEPLDAIKGVLKTKGDTDIIANSVVIIDDALKNIYDQAKADMGNLALRLDQLGVDVVLDDARLMLQPYAKQRDVRLMFDSGNPHMLGFFDRERIMRVLSNLVGNAIKFSPKSGKVMVKLRSDQQFVYISVEDNGPGIPESKLSTIFTNFWQASGTSDQGAGIGLAIVKTIVEAHGGTIKVESRVGVGSTFTFSLPRRRPVGAQINRQAATVRPSPRDISHTPVQP